MLHYDYRVIKVHGRLWNLLIRLKLQIITKLLKNRWVRNYSRITINENMPCHIDFLLTDLQTIEHRINDRVYNKLSDFIGDMTKIFDNCRYYNPKESPFFKCAESLEAYFVNKIKFLREKLFETNK